MKRVLIVEDNAANRALVTIFLKRDGYRVSLAEDGLRGVELAQAEKPDMILMDLEMPGMDGREATRRIKADPATSRIPIVALTAHTAKADIESAITAGFDGFVSKPISHSRPMEKVHSFPEGHDSALGEGVSVGRRR